MRLHEKSWDKKIQIFCLKTVYFEILTFCCFEIVQLRFRFSQLTHRMENVPKKKKVEILIYSHIFQIWLWWSTARLARLIETGRNSNTKKRIAKWLYEYAYGVCSYFRGQVSKFYFTCYSLPITLPWNAVNTSLIFKNKALLSGVTKKITQTLKSQKEKRNEKKKRKK